MLRQYSLAEEVAWEDLSHADLAEVCLRTDATQVESEVIEIRFFLERVRIDRGRQAAESSGQSLPPVERTLLLHHLLRADGAPLTGRQLGFAQIRGAQGYLGPFRGRIVERLAAAFGGEPEAFDEAARLSGGEHQAFAAHAYLFRAFPRVPVTLILWPGDDEIGADAQATYDSSVESYLAIEDVVVTTERLLGRLGGASRKRL